jgi:integrase/recombinase XerD
MPWWFTTRIDKEENFSFRKGAAMSYEGFQNYLKTEEGRLEGTRKEYTEDLVRFRAWLDELPVPPAWEHVTEREVRNYFTWLGLERTLKTKKGKRKLEPISPRYQRRIHASLNKWFTYLMVVEKSRSSNPLETVKKPPIPKRNPPALRADEVSKLVNISLEESRSSERIRNWAVITFLFHTGLRISELCNMKLSDITYREGLPKTLSVIGKGNKERKISLNDEAARVLTYWLREVHRPLLNSLGPNKNGEYVWLIPAGKARGNVTQPQTIRVMLRKFGNITNLKVHPHKLRHSFATEAVKHGAKLHALKEAMGHESLSTTGQYTHADERELELVGAVMPRVLDKGAESKADEGLEDIWKGLSVEQRKRLLEKVSSTS